MIKISKRFYSTMLFLFMVIVIYGQGSTTSSMSGKITDDQNQSMPGATVVATHEPSGTVYGATTNNQGKYYIAGMPPGDPYRV